MSIRSICHCLDVIHAIFLLSAVSCRYTLHVVKGTLAPSLHLRARQLERLPSSCREQQIREWRGLRDTCISASLSSFPCPSAWTTQHTENDSEFCNTANCQPKLIFMFCTHGCTAERASSGVWHTCVDLAWLMATHFKILSIDCTWICFRATSSYLFLDTSTFLKYYLFISEYLG